VRRQHRDVAYAGTDIQNTLPRCETSFTKESLGNWSEPNRLSNQALVLGIGVAEMIRILQR
jgi:hypothetical protein